MSAKYSQDPFYWQNNRNNQIAKNYGVHESSVSRYRRRLIARYGKNYECKVKGWYDWANVDWSKKDEEIVNNWKGSKTPKILTVSSWREKLKMTDTSVNFK